VGVVGAELGVALQGFDALLLAAAGMVGRIPNMTWRFDGGRNPTEGYFGGAAKAEKSVDTPSQNAIAGTAVMRAPKTRRGRSPAWCAIYGGVSKQRDAEQLRNGRRALVEDQVAVLVALVEVDLGRLGVAVLRMNQVPHGGGAAREMGWLAVE